MVRTHTALWLLARPRQEPSGGVSHRAALFTVRRARAPKGPWIKNPWGTACVLGNRGEEQQRGEEGEGQEKGREGGRERGRVNGDEQEHGEGRKGQHIFVGSLVGWYT